MSKEASASSMPDFYDHEYGLAASSVSEDPLPANPAFRSAFARNFLTTTNFRYRQNISTLFNPPIPTGGPSQALIATPSDFPDQPTHLPRNWHTPMALPATTGIQPGAIPNTSSDIQSDLQLVLKAGLMSEEEYFAVSGDPEVSVRTIEVEELGEVLRLPRSGYGMPEVELVEKVDVKQVVTLPSWGVRAPKEGWPGVGERGGSPSRQLRGELDVVAESAEVGMGVKVIGEVGTKAGGAFAGRRDGGFFGAILTWTCWGLLYALIIYVMAVGGSWLAMQGPSG